MPHLYLVAGVEVLGVEGQPALSHSVSHHGQDLLDVCARLSICRAPAKLGVEVVRDDLVWQGCYRRGM